MPIWCTLHELALHPCDGMEAPHNSVKFVIFTYPHKLQLPVHIRYNHLITSADLVGVCPPSVLLDTRVVPQDGLAGHGVAPQLHQLVHEARPGFGEQGGGSVAGHLQEQEAGGGGWGSVQGIGLRISIDGEY